MSELIQIRNRDSLLGKDEFHCSITDRLDEFQDNAFMTRSTYKDVMKTYMMIPEIHDDKWHIPIRVPGATRGHIFVEPDNGYWRVNEVVLYESTAVVGTSNIGCYAPGVIDILDEFKGLIIDFKEHNPKGGN